MEAIKSKGIKDPDVLHAIDTVPRHFFFDSSFLAFAYEDKAFPISAGQTISQPYTVAFQTELLEIKKGERVLEVGTGSGYQACILAEMGVKVFSIERQKSLYDKAVIFIPSMGYMVKLFYGDGYLGLPPFAPFDKIIITAAAPFIPPKLVQQLKVGGMMVIPVDEGEVQRMLRLTKLADGSIQEEAFQAFSFVPMLTGKNR